MRRLRFRIGNGLVLFVGLALGACSSSDAGDVDVDASMYGGSTEPDSAAEMLCLEEGQLPDLSCPEGCDLTYGSLYEYDAGAGCFRLMEGSPWRVLVCQRPWVSPGVTGEAVVCSTDGLFAAHTTDGDVNIEHTLIARGRVACDALPLTICDD